MLECKRDSLLEEIFVDFKSTRMDERLPRFYKNKKNKNDIKI